MFCGKQYTLPPGRDLSRTGRNPGQEKKPGEGVSSPGGSAVLEQPVHKAGGEGDIAAAAPCASGRRRGWRRAPCPAGAADPPPDPLPSGASAKQRHDGKHRDSLCTSRLTAMAPRHRSSACITCRLSHSSFSTSMTNSIARQHQRLLAHRQQHGHDAVKPDIEPQDSLAHNLLLYPPIRSPVFREQKSSPHTKRQTLRTGDYIIQLVQAIYKRLRIGSQLNSQVCLLLEALFLCRRPLAQA